MKKRYTIGGVLLLCFASWSFVTPQEDVQDKILSYFGVHRVIAQEKLYLHLDKPYYSAGDEIFFRGYLVDAITHDRKSVPTNFIYVELKNSHDSVLIRRKYRRDSLDFSGSIPLLPSLKEGNYSLVAYTEWMRNWDSDFFYSRRVYIGNRIMKKVNLSTEYLPQEEGGHRLKLYLNDSETQKAVIDARVEYELFDDKDKRIRFGNQAVTGDGAIYITLPGEKGLNTNLRLDAHITRPAGKSRHTLYLPPLVDDFAVTFFPEGGKMIAGVGSVMAFKAQNVSGYSDQVEGTVYDAAGAEVLTFKSEHDGMGSFVMKPSTQKYTAKVVSSSGVEKTFDLPLAETSGCGVILSFSEEYVFYKVISAAVSLDGMILVAHQRGDVSFAQGITGRNRSGKVPLSMFGDGIVHFMLLDPAGEPVSQRLCFVKTPKAVEVDVKPSKGRYEKREKMVLEVALTDENSQPIAGEFSVSVTDARQVFYDHSNQNNLLSHLLLASDIKGYLHNPYYYFQSNNSKISRHLDLVMLTHGWSRFNVDNINVLPNAVLPFYKEKGQVIAGKVLNLIKKGAKDATVSLMAMGKEIVDAAETNEQGEFLFDKISFQDTTLFLLHAKNKRGSDVVFPELEELGWPVSTSKEPLGGWQNSDTTLLSRYLETTKENYYNEGGMPEYDLESVVVYGAKQEPLRSKYTGIGSTVRSPDQFLHPGINTAYDAVLRLPGVTIASGGGFSIRGGTPLVIIDEFPYENISDAVDILKVIEASGVKMLEVIQGASMAIIPTSGINPSGVIVVTLQSGFIQKPEKSPSLRMFSRLGYTDSKEFYSPVYDTPEKQLEGKLDNRSTIFWSPRIVTDANGKAQLSFYSSDHPGQYEVVIEGMGVDNRLFYKKMFIN